MAFFCFLRNSSINRWSFNKCLIIILSISVLSALLFMTSSSQRDGYYRTVDRVSGGNKVDRGLKMVLPAATTTTTTTSSYNNRLSIITVDSARYEKRNQRIREVCKRIVKKSPVFVTYDNSSKPIEGIDSSPFTEVPNTSHFSLAPSFRTMGCFLNKVASSSLVTAFLQTRGLGPTFSSPHSYTHHLHPKSMEQFLEANSTYFKFMFVRHPMSRMLSCYLDKMVESDHPKLPAFRAYVKKRASQIIGERNQIESAVRKRIITRREISRRSYKSITTATSSSSSALTGTRLLNYSYQTRDSKPPATLYMGNNTLSQDENSKEAMNNESLKITPTFEEFLEFILDSDLQGVGYDSHWVPYHRFCTPCSMDYDVIGKLETGQEDFQYIWSRTGLDKSQIPVPWFNRIKSALPKSTDKPDMEAKHYATLPRKLILRFYDAFQLDFLMFDFSINEVLLKAGFDQIQ